MSSTVKTIIFVKKGVNTGLRTAQKYEVCSIFFRISVLCDHSSLFLCVCVCTFR